MYQERLRKILDELEDIQRQIMSGISIDPTLLEGVKVEDLDFLEKNTDMHISVAYGHIDRLIDTLNGDLL